MRMWRRPGLLGDIDLDDLTTTHQLCNGLARQLYGFVARRAFDPARRQGRDSHLDTALSLLSENLMCIA